MVKILSKFNYLYYTFSIKIVFYTDPLQVTSELLCIFFCVIIPSSCQLEK